MKKMQSGVIAAFTAVIITMAGMSMAGSARVESGTPFGLLRGHSGAAPAVLFPTGQRIRMLQRAAAVRDLPRTADGMILRVPRPVGKTFTAVLPDGVDSHQQRFKTLSAFTDHDYYLIENDHKENVYTALKACDGNVQAFPNIIKRLDQTLPADPHFSDQWCHLNPDNPYADMDAPQAWDKTTGSNEVVVALIDSGVDYNHPDLMASIWTNPGEISGNSIDDDGNGYVDDIHGIDTGDGDSDPMDYDGHGTHVAGIMGAQGDNGLGVCGINWQVKIMVLKGFEEVSDGMDTAMEIEAIDYILAMKERGVNIVAVNASYGYTGEEDSLEKEAIEALGQAGILFVAAAGNSAEDNDADPADTHFPSSYDLDTIVSVAASDPDGLLADFSCFGAVSVDLAAPGDTILSTVMGDHTYTPAFGDLFFDDMESGDANWTPEDTWAITEEQGSSPVGAWSDSPDDSYGTNADMALTGPVINLSKETGPLALGFSVNYEIEEPGIYNFDSLQAWYLAPPETDGDEPVWEEICALAGSSDGQWEVYSALIPQRFFWEGFQFRLVLHSDDSIQKDGVYIDDVGIGVPEMIYPYAYYSGTSMATPQVTGAAGLVAAAFADLGPADIKARLLDGTRPLPDLDGTVATGGQLSLYGALSDPTLDSDDDGVPDFYDNCPATTNAGQVDTDNDGWGNACDCDLNNDDTVNQADFMQLRSFWGTDEALVDFNSDGMVNQVDFMIFRGHWGAGAPFE